MNLRNKCPLARPDRDQILRQQFSQRILDGCVTDSHLPRDLIYLQPLAGCQLAGKDFPAKQSVDVFTDQLKTTVREGLRHRSRHSNLCYICSQRLSSPKPASDTFPLKKPSGSKTGVLARRSVVPANNLIQIEIIELNAGYANVFPC
jgi:hypothetical protein